MKPYFRYPADEYDKGRIYENIPFWIDEVTRIAGLKKGSIVLDLGCGTGNYAIELKKKTSAEVYGLDPSAGMIKVSRSKELGKAINWYVSVAESLPFASEFFDCIFASQVWHHIQDKQKAADECHRVLKRGSPLIVRTISHEQLMKRMVFKFFPEILSSQLEVYPTTKEFRECFGKAGFSSVEIHPYQLKRHIPPEFFIEIAKKKICSMFKSLLDTGKKKG